MRFLCNLGMLDVFEGFKINIIHKNEICPICGWFRISIHVGVCSVFVCPTLCMRIQNTRPNMWINIYIHPRLCQDIPDWSARWLIVAVVHVELFLDEIEYKTLH